MPVWRRPQRRQRRSTGGKRGEGCHRSLRRDEQWCGGCTTRRLGTCSTRLSCCGCLDHAGTLSPRRCNNAGSVESTVHIPLQLDRYGCRMVLSRDRNGSVVEKRSTVVTATTTLQNPLSVFCDHSVDYACCAVPVCIKGMPNNGAGPAVFHVGNSCLA